MFKNFHLDKVILMDAHFSVRRGLVRKYILEFDLDRLMHTFKKNAGLETHAVPLGGWEEETCGLRGHFVGHFLSSCSKFAHADKDEQMKGVADEIVRILGMCAQANGYLSAFGEDTLDILESEENRNVWAPYYTLHKILQGLIDAYRYVGNGDALKLAVNLVMYIRGRFQKLSFWKIDGILRCTKVNPVNEFGGIGDALYSLHDITRDPEILALALIFDRDYFLDKMAAGKDVLENLHANTHLPMVIAAMHRFNVTGEDKYKVASLHFHDFLEGRTFANGNSSSKATACIKGQVSEKSEHWGACDDLHDALTGGESESCCAHNTEKILQQLFEWSGDIRYLDKIECLKYNSVLNCASRANGLSQYHQPMGQGVRKKFSRPYDDFWCCTASGIDAMSEIQKNIWFWDKDIILMNMFVSSTVVWDDLGVVIAQETDFPDNPVSRLKIGVRQPTAFTLMLKASAIKTVRVNGFVTDLQEKNGFFSLERIFHDGDEIGIDIQAGLAYVPLKGSQALEAVMYGKVLLAAIPNGNVTYTSIPNGNIMDTAVPNDIVPDGIMSQKMIRGSQAELEFISADEQGRQLRYIPLFRIEDETYSVYMDRMGTANSIPCPGAAKNGRTAYSIASG